MNTYVIPVADESGPWIASVKANNLHDAEEKLVALLVNEYDLDYCADLTDLKEATTDVIRIGSFYDIEEF